MKSLFLTTALLLLTTSPSWAADAPKTSATVVTPPDYEVTLSAQDVQILQITLANAGTACDQKTAIYCQLLSYRDGLQAKLAAAKPVAPAKVPEKK